MPPHTDGAEIYTFPLSRHRANDHLPPGGDFFESVDCFIDRYGRAQHLMNGEVGGFNQAFRLTDPSQYLDGQPATTILRFPGLGENIERGVGLVMHTELTREFPQARVITVTNNGHGKTSRAANPHRRPSAYGINAMADQRAELLKVLEAERVIVVGTSLGSVIGNKLVQVSLANQNELKIAGSIWYAPALVPPERAARDIARFVPEFAKDCSLEVGYRSNPIKKPLAFLGAVCILAASVKDYSVDARAAATQLLDLLKGTPLAEIENTPANMPTLPIVGTTDSLRELVMWRALDAKYPNLVLKEVAGRGHGMTLNPVKAIRKIAKTIREAGLL